MKTIIKEYFNLEKKIFEYFGYVEDWEVIPIGDLTDDHWMITGPKIVYGLKPFTKKLIVDGKEIYSGTIYTQRFLPKWIYQTPELTMISVDTHSDGNKILMIFDNELECKDESLKTLYNECWGLYE